MKHFFALVCILIGHFCLTQAQLPGGQIQKIDTDLSQRMQADPAAYHTVLLELPYKVNLAGMNENFRLKQVSKHERRVILVQALQEMARTTQADLLAKLAETPGIRPGSLISYWATNMVQVDATSTAILSLSQHADVAGIGALPEMHLYRSTHREEAAMAPDGREIGHDRINAPAMWSLGYTGAGVKVYVIDSGVEGGEPALDQNYWGRVTSDAVAWYGPNESNAPTDCDDGSHGTHVAGVICGIDRTTKDTIGVAPNAYWMGSPAIDSDEGGNLEQSCLGGPTSLQSLQWALNPDNNPNTTDDLPDVINNSWGSSPGSNPNCSSPGYTAYRDVITALETAGVAVLFAAGNDGNFSGVVPPEEIGFPGSIVVDSFNTFVVGAVNGNVASTPRAGFSSRGPSLCNPPGGETSLSIKPEIMAPGVTVRSCVEGGYARLSGTSFSSPMAAGAVALLMEAFPDLTGREVLRALYYSAIDLGIPGEDNLYGNGLIDVRAAYDWLVAQGNTPFQVPDNPDAYLVSVNAPLDGRVCDPLIAPVLTIENGGRTPINSLSINYSINGGAPVATNWTGTIDPGAQGEVALSSFILPEGLYDIEFEIDQTNNQNDYIVQNNSQSVTFSLIRENELTADSVVSVCSTDGDGVVSATASMPNSEIRWYDEPIGGSLLGSGENLYLEDIDPGNVYASAFSEGKVGIPDNTVGNGIYATLSEGGLVFDVNSDIVLRSVKVNTFSSGVQTVILRDANGQQMAMKTVALSGGTEEIPLDFNIPAGKDYYLGLTTPSTGNIFYTFQGTAFPYEFNGVVSIKNGLLSGTANEVYYFFYDWTIGYEASCERAPVLVDLVSNVVITDFSADRTEVGVGGEVRFSDRSIPNTSLTNWVWDFGDGNTSTDQNPRHIYQEEGEYIVTLTAFAGSGASFCGDADTMRIKVSALVSNGPAASDRTLSVHPNPSQGQFTLAWAQLSGQLTLSILDVLGNQLVRSELSSGARSHTVDLTAYPAGMYYVRVSDKHGSIVQKVMKQ